MDDADRDARVAALTERMRALGDPDAEVSARYEVDEDSAQEAGYLFLRSLWGEIDSWEARVDDLPAAVRASAAGASRQDVVLVAREAAYEAVFHVLSSIGSGGTDVEPDDPDDVPAAVLVETRQVDGRAELTGRDMNCLYQSLLTMDPSGREGGDLWS